MLRLLSNGVTELLFKCVWCVGLHVSTYLGHLSCQYLLKVLKYLGMYKIYLSPLKLRTRLFPLVHTQQDNLPYLAPHEPCSFLCLLNVSYQHVCLRNGMKSNEDEDLERGLRRGQAQDRAQDSGTSQEPASLQHPPERRRTEDSRGNSRHRGFTDGLRSVFNHMHLGSHRNRQQTDALGASAGQGVAQSSGSAAGTSQSNSQASYYGASDGWKEGSGKVSIASYDIAKENLERFLGNRWGGKTFKVTEVSLVLIEKVMEYTMLTTYLITGLET